MQDTTIHTKWFKNKELSGEEFMKGANKYNPLDDVRVVITKKIDTSPLKNIIINLPKPQLHTPPKPSSPQQRPYGPSSPYRPPSRPSSPPQQRPHGSPISPKPYSPPQQRPYGSPISPKPYSSPPQRPYGSPISPKPYSPPQQRPYGSPISPKPYSSPQQRPYGSSTPHHIGPTKRL